MPAVPELTVVRQDEVLTGEAVALDVQPLGVLMRSLGAIIDMVISGVLIFAAVLLLNLLDTVGALTEATFRILLIAFIVIILVAVPTAVETATRGRSVGKLAVGGRIARVDGGASGFRQAFIRALVGVLEIYLTLGALAFLVGAFTPRSQRLGDLLSGTYSERTRTPALPAAAPGLPPGLEQWASVVDVGPLPDRLSRRIAQFGRQAPNMQPSARARIAQELAAEARPHVSPVPPVDPETMLRAIMAVRRDREFRSLELEVGRVASLTAGTTGAPRGFPER